MKLGILSPLSGEQYDHAINRPRHKTMPDPKKLARLLMPNAY